MGTIVVTGSASGIGAATAERLRDEGHRVIGVDRNAADVVVDLGSPDGRLAAVEKIRAASGGTLDGVVSAAGLGPYDEAKAIARVNYFGAVAMLDDLQEMLANGEEPAAVAISSIGAVFIDLMVPDHREPEYHFIEANERPGLANHEPQPTAERFIDLLFPLSGAAASRVALNS